MSTLGSSERPGTPTSSTSITDSQSDTKFSLAKQPVFLPVGAAVSAKYRGAFCEALIERVDLNYRLRVQLKSKKATVTVDKTNVVSGNIEHNAEIIFKLTTGEHASNTSQTGTILRIVDISQYTVIFDDGDRRSLKRTQLVLKGERHFKESESLDQLPLTNPEQFKQPVIDHNRRYQSSPDESDQDDDIDVEASDKDNKMKEQVASDIETPARKPRVVPPTSNSQSRFSKSFEGTKKMPARRRKTVPTTGGSSESADISSQLGDPKDPTSYKSMLGSLVMVDMPIGSKAEAPLSPSNSLNSSLVSDVGGTPSRRRFTPGLVVLPSAMPSIDLKAAQAAAHELVLLVRSFRENRFYAVPQSCLQTLNQIEAVKLAHRNPYLRSAFERAILWLDRRELPGAWGIDIDNLLGPDWLNSNASDTNTTEAKRQATLKGTSAKSRATAVRQQRRLQRQKQRDSSSDSSTDEDGETSAASSSSFSVSKKNRSWNASEKKKTNRRAKTKKSQASKTTAAESKGRAFSISSFSGFSASSASSSTTSDDDSDVSSSSTNSAANFEARDRWIAHLYRFMDERGTSINKAPSIANKDLDLYKLYKIVHRLGGFHRVTSQLKWGAVYSEMDLPSNFTAGPRNLQTAFKKYLFPLDDLSRKLGTNLDEIPISRPRKPSQHQGNIALITSSRTTIAPSTISTPAASGKQSSADPTPASSGKESSRKQGSEKNLASKASGTPASPAKRNTEHNQPKPDDEARKEINEKAKEEKLIDAKGKSKVAPSSTKKAATAQQQNTSTSRGTESVKQGSKKQLSTSAVKADSAGDNSKWCADGSAISREKKSGEGTAEEIKPMPQHSTSSDTRNRSSRPAHSVTSHQSKKSTPNSSSTPKTTDHSKSTTKTVTPITDSLGNAKTHPMTSDTVLSKNCFQRLEVVKEPQSACSSPALSSFDKTDDTATKSVNNKSAPISVGSYVRVRYGGKSYSAKIVKHVYPTDGSTSSVGSSHLESRPKSTMKNFDTGLLSDNSGSSASSTTTSADVKYCVHYTGWNARHDEVVSRERIISVIKQAPTTEMRRSPSCSTLNLSGRAASLLDALRHPGTDVGTADASTSLSTRSIADDDDDNDEIAEEDENMEANDDEDCKTHPIATTHRRRARGYGLDETASDSVAAIKATTSAQAVRRKKLLSGLKRPRSSSAFSEIESILKMAKLTASKGDSRASSKRTSSTTSSATVPGEIQKKRRSLDTPLLSKSDRKSVGRPMKSEEDEKKKKKLDPSTESSSIKPSTKPRSVGSIAGTAVFSSSPSSATSQSELSKSALSIVHAATCLVNEPILLKRVMGASTPASVHPDQMTFADLEDISSDEDDFPPVRDSHKFGVAHQQQSSSERSNRAASVGTPLRRQQQPSISSTVPPPSKRVKQEPPTSTTTQKRIMSLATASSVNKIGRNTAAKRETTKTIKSSSGQPSASRKAVPKTEATGKSTTEIEKPWQLKARTRAPPPSAKFNRQSSSSSSSSGEAPDNRSSSDSESSSSAGEPEPEKKKTKQEFRRLSSRLTPQKSDAAQQAASAPVQPAAKSQKEEEKKKQDSSGNESDSSTSGSQFAASSDALPRLTRSQHRLLLGDTPPGAQLQTAATTHAPALAKEEEEKGEASISHLPTLQEEDEEGNVNVIKKVPSRESIAAETPSQEAVVETASSKETPSSSSKQLTSSSEYVKSLPSPSNSSASPVFTASSPLTKTASLELEGSQPKLLSVSPSSLWDSPPAAATTSSGGAAPTTSPLIGDSIANATGSRQRAPSEASFSTEPMLRSSCSPLFSSHDEDDDEEVEEAFGSAPQLFSPVSVSGGTVGNATVSDVEACLTTSDDDGEREAGDSSSKPMLLGSPVPSSTTSSSTIRVPSRRSSGSGANRRRRRRVHSTSGEITSTVSCMVDDDTAGKSTHAVATTSGFSSLEEFSESASSTTVTTASSSRRVGPSRRHNPRGGQSNRIGSPAIGSPLLTVASDTTGTTPDVQNSSPTTSSSLHPVPQPTAAVANSNLASPTAVTNTTAMETAPPVCGPTIRRFGGPFFPIAGFDSMTSELKCLNLQKNLHQILASWRSARQLLKDLDLHRASGRTRRLRTPARRQVSCGASSAERTASPKPCDSPFPSTPPSLTSQ